MSACCDVRDRIIHVDCEYRDNHQFIMQYLPGCLPTVFTARFKAPADFTEGDTIVVKGVEMPVMTSQMEPAGTGTFKCGAVMMCEMDLDRKLAFVRTGSTDTGQDVKFQSSDLVYYIDPFGDDSPNNPGGIDSPFKTLAGAGRVAWENTVMNPIGKLIFSFNPGTYELTEADHLYMVTATHPLGILFKGSDENNAPIIRTARILTANGRREFQSLKFDLINPDNSYMVSACENSTLMLIDCEIHLHQGNISVIQPNSGGFLRMVNTIKINGNGHRLIDILSCHQGTLWATGTRIILENIPSVENATVTNYSGQMYFNASAFVGSVGGKRYIVMDNGVINTVNAGPNFIPGTIAGSASGGGLYF